MQTTPKFMIKIDKWLLKFHRHMYKIMAVANRKNGDGNYKLKPLQHIHCTYMIILDK